MNPCKDDRQEHALLLPRFEQGRAGRSIRVLVFQRGGLVHCRVRYEQPHCASVKQRLT